MSEASQSIHLVIPNLLSLCGLRSLCFLLAPSTSRLISISVLFYFSGMFAY